MQRRLDILKACLLTASVVMGGVAMMFDTKWLLNVALGFVMLILVVVAWELALDR